MCGIAGILTPDPREAEAVLARMVPAMLHRGPDDAGSVVVPSTLPDGAPGVAGLGFRRLSILDLTPSGHQPMVDLETGNCIVFNGEIYNHRALRAELESAGCRFRSTSDTEVLLQALGRWGDRALERIEGMYSFAFSRAADRALMLARDPLGIKPLYVAQAGERMLFASEIRTILAAGLVPRDLSTQGIAGLMAFGSVQAPHTVFADITEFPAAHFQWIGGPPRRFWDFPEIGHPRESDVSGLVRDRVFDAVRSHLVADVPVGVLLSAGVDSTIIAACAAESGADITAFTVSIGDRFPEDEATVASATARSLGLDHHVVPIDAGELKALWPRWIESLDSPSIDGFNTWLVTKALAERGMKAGLSGLGADEVFGGYSVFGIATTLQRWTSSLRALPRRGVAGTTRWILRTLGRPGPAEKLPDLLTGGSDLGSIAAGMRRITSDAGLRSLGLLLPESPRVATEPLDAFNEISRIEMTQYMRNTLLRDSDANSMSHALELRVPFLDLQLVNAVASLPGHLKQSSRGPGKRLLRAAMTKHLPPEVKARSKTGFALPIDGWMRGEMREYCQSAVEAFAGIPELDGDHARSVWTRYVESSAGESWAQPFAMVVTGAYMQKEGIGSPAHPARSSASEGVRAPSRPVGLGAPT